MTPLEFLALFSIVPVGALLLAAFVYALVRRDRRRTGVPGE
jgi:hypothetical protein